MRRRELIEHLRTTIYHGAITMDAWTNSTGEKKFLGVTLHFMDDKYRMKTIAIGMAEMLKAQKADYICMQFSKLIFYFNFYFCFYPLLNLTHTFP